MLQTVRNWLRALRVSKHRRRLEEQAHIQWAESLLLPQDMETELPYKPPS